MAPEEIDIKVKSAIATFMDDHRPLLLVNANERSITHKFAECLIPLFPGWDIDCEYNRDGYDIKTIGEGPVGISSDDENAVTIFPDIIVHHRTHAALHEAGEGKFFFFTNILGA